MKDYLDQLRNDIIIYHSTLKNLLSKQKYNEYLADVQNYYSSLPLIESYNAKRYWKLAQFAFMLRNRYNINGSVKLEYRSNKIAESAMELFEGLDVLDKQCFCLPSESIYLQPEWELYVPIWNKQSASYHARCVMQKMYLLD